MKINKFSFYQIVFIPKLIWLFMFIHETPLTAEIKNNNSSRYLQLKTPNMDGIGKFYFGREISHVMGHQGAEWLERPEREFGAQKFVFHQADKAAWLLSDVPGIRYRNTGIASATGGVASAVVVRADGRCGDIPLRHSAKFRFCYFLEGSATLVNGDSISVSRGDAIAVPPNVGCRLEQLSEGAELLEVFVPRN